MMCTVSSGGATFVQGDAPASPDLLNSNTIIWYVYIFAHSKIVIRTS